MNTLAFGSGFPASFRDALRFGKIANKKDSITLELTKAQVAAAPEYKEDAPIVVLGASGSLQPLQAIQ